MELRGGALTTIAFFVFGMPSGLGCALSWLTFGSALFAAAHYTRRHPMYLTTDVTGIGLTTWRGSRALRWSEIRSLREQRRGLGWNERCCLILQASRRVVVHLMAYAPETRQELIDLIRARAGLDPDDRQPRLYVRPEAALPEGKSEDRSVTPTPGRLPPSSGTQE